MPVFQKRVLDPEAGYSFSHTQEDNPYEEGARNTYVVARHKGQIVGMATICHRQDSPSAEPISVQVDEFHRRKGVASAMYDHFEKFTGKTVVPSTLQTKEGKALWAGNKQNPQFGKAKIYKSELKPPTFFRDEAQKIAARKSRIDELAATTKGSAWQPIPKPGRAKNVVLIVSANTHPHSLPWRVSRIMQTGQGPVPFHHTTHLTHEEALAEAAREGADLHSTPLQVMKKDEDQDTFDLLAKGAMQRLAPFNPQKDRLSPDQEEALARWQSSEADPEHRLGGSMPANARIRALHKLSNKTSVRRGINGEREFLLHRGVSPEEQKKVMAEESRNNAAMA